MEILERLPGALLPWFEENKRELPWRQDRQPYHVWLSEIMLQQTRVEAVKGYYTRFLQELPTIEALANCEDDRLRKLWEGLGYYSRVRNLKKAARIIVDRYGGVFPDDYGQIIDLPGIGAYTAGAISSISFGQKRAAVDGNVLRVYARVMNDGTAIDRPEFKAKVAGELEGIYPEQTGDFTQALMELGATVCGPNWTPRCEECPCRDFCLGKKLGTAEKLPNKSEKKPKKQEKRTVFILECQGEYALTKRPDKGLLASLWEFPNVEQWLEIADGVTRVEQWGMQVQDVQRQLEKKHIFTHVVWEMRGFYMKVQHKNEEFRWFTAEQIAQEAALPTAFRQFWEAMER